MLQVGDKAPDFTLPDSNMELNTLSDIYRENTVVLYFYPRDDTPGCTIQATDFTDMLADFEKLGARVVGVSQDDCFSHQSFIDKFGLLITLLADVESDASNAFGVLQQNPDSGRISAIRASFVIDKAGVIRYAEYGVQPKGHARMLLDLLKDI